MEKFIHSSKYIKIKDEIETKRFQVLDFLDFFKKWINGLENSEVSKILASITDS